MFNIRRPLSVALATVISIVSLSATNTVVLVDGSGSVAGLSPVRPYNSIRKVMTELTAYMSGRTAQDTVSMVYT